MKDEKMEVEEEEGYYLCFMLFAVKIRFLQLTVPQFHQYNYYTA